MRAIKIFRCIAMAGVCIIGFVSGQAAAAWPDGPVKVILPFGAGGSSDVTARLLSAKLSQKVNATFVVENKAGANGMIGATQVARSKPDGQTLLVTPSGPITVVPQVLASATDVHSDLIPISMLVRVPVGVAVNAASGITSIKQLIEYGRQNPGKLNYGISGIGTHMHLVGAMLSQAAGIQMTPVPFNGSNQAATALLGNHIQVVVGDLISLTPLHEQGVRVLAIADPARSAVAPDLPTIAEEALPGFGLSTWIGLFAPAGTPPDIVSKLEQATREVMKDPEMETLMARAGLETVGGSGTEFRASIEADIPRLKQIVKEASIQAQ